MDKITAFSKKQRQVLTWWNEKSKKSGCAGIICDGAVRSGKTMSMSLSFIFWSFFQFSSADFAFCGRSRLSVERNLIRPLVRILERTGSCEIKEQSGKYLEITMLGRTNRYYYFGGNDSSSASIIQGITLAGVMFDEVVLMPQDFVLQAIARCSLKGSKFWFNCNPEHPHHWFYREWILKKEEKNICYFHFTMDDNPSLSPEIKKRYSTLYSGRFHKRFVLGEWCVSSGLVYSVFDEEKHCVSGEETSFEEFYISCDYGTVNPTSMGLWGRFNGVWTRTAEYYFDSKKEGYMKTDSEHYESLVLLAGNRKIEGIVIDPSAASLSELIRREGKFTVIKAKNEIVNGIRRVSQSLKSGKIKIDKKCEESIREFSLYKYDASGASDMPVQEYDHAMDEIRYFTNTVIYAEEKKEDEFYVFALDR